MRDGWIETTLGDVATRVIGRTPQRKTARYWTSDLTMPFFTIADMTSRWVTQGREGVTAEAVREGQAKAVPAGSLLLSFKLSIGKVAITDREVYTNEAIAWVQPGPRVTRDYLALALECVPWDDLGGRAVKGKTMNKASLDAVRLVLPPRDEQQRIVDLIAAVDEAMEAARTLRSTLSKALAERRDMLFSAAEVRPAGEVFEILIGLQRSPGRAAGPNQTRYLRSANVTHGSLILDDVKSMSFDERQQVKYALQPGDVLVSEGSASPEAVGAPSKYLGEVDGIVGFQNTLLRYRAVEGITTPEFVSQWCSWAYESGAFREAASGTNIKHIGSGGASRMSVAAIPLEEQTPLTEELRAAQDALESADRSAAALRELRSNLLTVLLSGEHEIPESYDELMEAS